MGYTVTQDVSWGRLTRGQLVPSPVTHDVSWGRLTRGHIVPSQP